MTALPHLHQGQLVGHADCPGEHFFVDRFEGHSSGGKFKWRIWLRGVEKYSHIPFPAQPNQLLPITLN